LTGAPAVRLTLACWDYDRIRALVDGRVRVDGVDLDWLNLTPEQAFARAFTDAPYDITELSFSNTVTAVSKGDFPYALIPVFPSRAFRHGTLYVRTDRGIRAPRDLEGRRVGIQEYDMTAAVVLRGCLRDGYGVDPFAIRWRVGEKVRTKPLEFPLPDRRPTRLDLEILAPGVSLEDRLLAGELDAIASLRVPASFVAGDPRIARLFADPQTEERAFFARTRLFPIMHVIGVKKSVVAQMPSLPGALTRAFHEAKGLALDELAITQAPKVTLPWIADTLRETRALMGEDFWPYGLAENRATLEAQLAWSRADGLQARPVTVDELFAGV